ncbi:hypothetical protein O6H91_Y112600 [Diphasiastrum complanatum]|nr:hypothetical protein O6H91_Y112600 [Diphasiastrum complanatum]KAJ7296606.1 hypothetical protein O6H91_Y112600 [Diphasiastrum complanatum]KAJ7296608.1 hypothetical protein O6H91_Y112600 [Diphasiastrum complanatum]
MNGGICWEIPQRDNDRGVLVNMCLKVACQSKQNVNAWRRQRRTLERMPAHLAEPLLHQLYHNHLLSAPLLELFQQSVEEVNLSGDPGVDAEWLAYLGGFGHLRALRLADCKSLNNGAIWPLSGLRQLEALELSRCAKVTDEGLEHLLCLISLTKLGLSETGVGPVGVARLSMLPNLTYLDLGGLPVSDSQLAALQVLCGLTHLDLWGTKISNNGACYLKAFQNLRTLNLSWTNITIIPPLLSLVSLNLCNCTVVSIFEGIAEQPVKLEQLYLSGSVIADPLRALGGVIVRKLSSLVLSASNISSFSFLYGIRGLQKLDLSSTGATDAVMHIVAANGQELRYLNLGHTKVGLEGVAVLSGHVSKLEFISLTGTTVDDSVFLYLGLMPLLQTMDLSHTKVKGANIICGEKTWSMSTLKQLCHLRFLDLRSSGITDKSCRRLASLQQLSHLFLRSDFLSDTSFHSLSGLLKLVTLYFQGSILTDSGLSTFQPPPMLQELDVTDCWLLTKTSLLQFSERNPQILLRHELVMEKIDDTARPKHVANSTNQKIGIDQFSQDKFNSRELKSHGFHSSRSDITSMKNIRDRRTRGINSTGNTIRKGESSNVCADERRKYSLSELLRLRPSLCSSPAFSNLDFTELQELLLKR